MLIAAISSILFSCGYVFGRITTLFSSYNVFMSAILITLFLLDSLSATNKKSEKNMVKNKIWIGKSYFKIRQIPTEVCLFYDL